MRRHIGKTSGHLRQNASTFGAKHFDVFEKQFGLLEKELILFGVSRFLVYYDDRVAELLQSVSQRETDYGAYVCRSVDSLGHSYKARSFFSSFMKLSINSLLLARMYLWKAWTERCPESVMM